MNDSFGEWFLCPSTIPQYKGRVLYLIDITYIRIHLLLKQYSLLTEEAEKKETEEAKKAAAEAERKRKEANIKEQLKKELLAYCMIIYPNGVPSNSDKSYLSDSIKEKLKRGFDEQKNVIHIDKETKNYRLDLLYEDAFLSSNDLKKDNFNTITFLVLLKNLVLYHEVLYLPKLVQFLSEIRKVILENISEIPMNTIYMLLYCFSSNDLRNNYKNVFSILKNNGKFIAIFDNKDFKDVLYVLQDRFPEDKCVYLQMKHYIDYSITIINSFLTKQQNGQKDLRSIQKNDLLSNVNPAYYLSYFIQQSKFDDQSGDFIPKKNVQNVFFSTDLSIGPSSEFKLVAIAEDSGRDYLGFNHSEVLINLMSNVKNDKLFKKVLQNNPKWLENDQSVFDKVATFYQLITIFNGSGIQLPKDENKDNDKDREDKKQIREKIEKGQDQIYSSIHQFLVFLCQFTQES